MNDPSSHDSEGEASQPVEAPPPADNAATVSAVLPQAGDVTANWGGSGGVTPPHTPRLPVADGSRQEELSHVLSVPGYEVLEELGRGAMGVVFKARQLGLNRLVALKVVRAGVHASSAQRARFQSEVAALARLRHPNIVPIHQVGEVQGLPFFAMEYLSGGTLAQQLRERRPPPREAARLIATLARAVQHAHEAGVVHRDLKPANVLLDADGTPRIADFGLARHLESPQGPTCTGAVLGTPSYMAPEQAAGQKHAIGPQSDVYSLGALLYELLTGRPPFRAASPTETILQVLQDEPVPPSRLHAGLCQPLEVICLKCLARDPGRRYHSAGALADDLERFLRGEPIQARPVPAVTRVLLWARRRPAQAALLVLTVLLLLSTLVGLLGFAHHEQQRRLEAEDLRSKTEEARQKLAKHREEARLLAGQEVKARGLAESERQAARRETALLFLERGRDLCERGEVRSGLLWMARSLEFAADETDLQPIVRLNLAGWLRQLSPAHRTQLEAGHVVAGAFSPDGRRVATGKGSTVSLFDQATGKQLWTVPMARPVTALVWSRDSRLLAAGSGSGTQDNWGKAGPGSVQVIDVETGRVRGEAREHPHTVRCLAFSPDGKHLLTGCQDGHARLWDLETGKLHKLIKLETPVVGVGFSPERYFLTVVSRNAPDKEDGGEVQLWETATGEAGPSFSAPNASTAAVSSDGRTLALAGQRAGMEVRWCDPASADFGKRVGPKMHSGSEWAIALSGDSSLLASCGLDWRARIHATATGQQLGQTLLLNGWVYVVALSPDGKTLLTGDGSSSALWDLSPPRRPEAMLQAERIQVLTFSPDRSRLAAVLDDHRVQLFDARTGQARGPALALPAGCPRLALGPDNSTLLTCGYDRQVRVWNGETGKLIHANPGSIHLRSMW